MSASPLVLDASAAIAIIRLEPPASAIRASLRDSLTTGDAAGQR